MTVFTPNIPQPTDNPSDSQDQILENFQTLERLYGINGDHYSWTNTGPTESTKHAKVTTPGLPTATAPGNALPLPLAGNCSYFGQTRNSQTYPYIARDGLGPVAPLTNIWPLLPIKAYAIITSTNFTTVSLVDSFNMNAPTASGSNPTQTITVNLTNAMRTTNYGVLITTTRGSASFSYSIVNASQFTITIGSLPSTYTPFNITVIAIES